MFDPISRLHPLILTLDGDGASGGGDGGDGNDGGGYTPPATQADLDRIINGATAKVHKRYEGYDDFKAKAAKWDEYEANAGGGNGGGDQAAIEAARNEGKAEGEQSTAARYQRRLVSTEAKSIAASLGFNDPADALAVIDPEKLPIKDDEPDTDEIKKLVEELAEKKPYLVGKGTQPRRRPQPRPGEQQQNDTAKGGKASAALRQLAASRKGH